MNVAELRQELSFIEGTFESSFPDADPPNEVAIAQANIILNMMDQLHLDADFLSYTTDGGIGFSWRSVVTPSHYAHIECGNDGGVNGVRSDRSVNYNDPDFCKFFWIGELCPTDGEPGFNCPDEGELVLTLEEALEHIRAYIWADYK